MKILRLMVPAMFLASAHMAQAQDSFGGSGGGGGAGMRPAPQAGTAQWPAPPDGQPQNPAGAPPSQPAPADQLSQMERADMGVPPTRELHAGAMHGPTPASIPGGQLITTRGLQELASGRQTPFLLLDILGGPQVIPGAQYAVPAAQPGSFNDSTQQQFGQFLQQATGGNKEYPLVLYCQSRECWMSYNAALRAIQLGFTNVLWYRGGVEAWQAAGLPLQQAGQGNQR